MAQSNGFGELASLFRETPKFAAQAIVDFHDDFLDEVETELQAKAPRRTGNLSRSFHRRGNSVVSDADYAAIVDKKQPFVDRAVDSAIVRTTDYTPRPTGGGYARARGKVAASSDIFQAGDD